jgi:DNA-binding GntR family transcriptional regulator
MSDAFILNELREDVDARQSTRAHRVFDVIREAIVHLRFKPGNLLSEAEVSRQLGVSRQPVREAFIKLDEAGLVEVRPQRGTFVKLISRREVENARFIREAVEAAVARKAAVQARDEHVAVLRGIVENQMRFANDGDTGAFLRLDETFHHAVAHSADCDYAWHVLEGLKAQMDRVRWLYTPDATPIGMLIDQHAAIVDAIAAGSPDAAEQAMRSHLSEILVSLPRLAALHPDYFTD